MNQNRAQNEVFCHFFKFGSLVFLEIAQDYSLERRLNKSRQKNPCKKFGRPQIGSEIRDFAIFSRLYHQFALIYIYFLVSLFRVGVFFQQLTLRQLIQPDLESRFSVRPQLGPSIQSRSSSSAGLDTGGHTIHPPIEGLLLPEQLDYSCMPLHPAQDCSLGQYLTCSRTETSRKIFCGPNWGQSDLFYSNVVERPLKLVCFLRISLQGW